MDNFIDKLTQQREIMDKTIKRDEYLRTVMLDPSKAIDFEDDVIEENIGLLLVSNEAHANVEISYKNREL